MKEKEALLEKEVYFRQYKLYVQGMEKISDRRLITNNYFITVNAALIALAGLFYSSKLIEKNLCMLNFLGAIGIILAIIWFLIILSYKQLNTGKFKIIHKIEKSLPLQLYQKEWTELGEGRNPRQYIPFSHIEMAVPIVFGIIYISLFILSIGRC